MSERRRFAPVTSDAVAPALVSETPALAVHSQPEPLVPSRNWAGYVVYRGGPFRQVRAAWVHPSVACTGPVHSAVAIWVGLGGIETSPTLEQTGTLASCQDGKARHANWYEMVPADVVFYNDPVRAGDELWAQVTFLGQDTFELLLQNFTAGWMELTYAQHPDGPKPDRMSAEVIVEAPNGPSGYSPLADFGALSLTSCMVDGQSIGSYAARGDLKVYDMERDGIRLATPSRLTGGGTAFDVTWENP
ncbi:G1 family glutamic endopeptidase [Streptomyces sp. NBC_00572]|uniref:G1 family glutamic endopeptidase n=1 Tax=Streptomyces sp. NBC_00572 TaxID=2903664 RepID=UPI002254B4AC|nr:G1 family glutamic endopeptidase [Streptomyces sp. NBC_00572]MCX4985503.1 G1 family endopeptidase [Streptomyces sp. NBC_00572]